MHHVKIKANFTIIIKLNMEESINSRNLNRHKNKQCKACNRIISGANWARHCARKHNNIFQAYEFTDKKANTSDPLAGEHHIKTDLGQEMMSAFNVSSHRTLELKEKIEVLTKTVEKLSQKRSHPEEEDEKEEEEEEEKKEEKKEEKEEKMMQWSDVKEKTRIHLQVKRLKEKTIKKYMGILDSITTNNPDPSILLTQAGVDQILTTVTAKASQTQKNWQIVISHIIETSFPDAKIKLSAIKVEHKSKTCPLHADIEYAVRLSFSCLGEKPIALRQGLARP